MVEQRPEEPCVTGSSPVGATKRIQIGKKPIFCYNGLMEKITGFNFDHRSSIFGFTLLDGSAQFEHGNAILSKIPFEKTEEIDILGEYDSAHSLENYKSALWNHRLTAQKVTLKNGLVVVNYHGYWLRDPMGDDVSVACMKTIANSIKNESSPIVMCGDLNVVSEAPCMRELDFLQDLTKLNNVKSTLRNIRFKRDIACDHILVSDNVTYENFEVINEPVSDHKALSVTITL